jgi:hypothetical protein
MSHICSVCKDLDNLTERLCKCGQAIHTYRELRDAFHKKHPVRQSGYRFTRSVNGKRARFNTHETCWVQHYSKCPKNRRIA